jgi:hypothetical protein
MSSDADEPSVSEDDCVECGHLPAADRAAMRFLINTISLSDDVCQECEMAFWRNLGFLHEPTKH